MQLYRVKIFPKTKDFDMELLDFLFENSSSFKREFSINNILNSNCSPPTIDEILESSNSVDIDEIPGSTFQSHWRSNKDIYATSHLIKSIYKENGFYFALIKPSPHSEIIDFEKGILRPIYYKKNDHDKYRLVTFDIDFNIT